MIKNARLLFQQSWPGSTQLHAQYYHFDTNNQVLVLTDQSNQQAYFYDLQGNEALPSPVATLGRVAMIYQRNTATYTIYTTAGNKYSLLRLRK